MACDVCKGINTKDCPVCGTPPRWMECPECGGYGMTDCTAWNIMTEEVVDVTPTAFMMLPDTEEEARRKRQNYCKNDCGECQLCGGKGRIYAVPDAI